MEERDDEDTQREGERSHVVSSQLGCRQSPCPCHRPFFSTASTYILTFRAREGHEITCYNELDVGEYSPTSRQCRHTKTLSIFFALCDLQMTECMLVMKHIRKYILACIETTKLDIVPKNHFEHVSISYTPYSSKRIRKRAVVQSQHHRRPQIGLYGVRPWYSSKPTISEPVPSLPATSR